MSEITDAIDRFRAELLARDRAAAAELARAYALVWQRTRVQLAELERQIELARTRGEDISATWLLQRDRLRTLTAQVEAEIRQFAQFAESKIIAEQVEAVALAQEHAEALMQLALPPGVHATFARLPREAIESLVGTLRDGTPLRKLLDELGPEASKEVLDALITGLALGQNPRVIARTIRRALGGNLVRALRIARTETLRAYREATLASYRANSDVVGGWTWVASMSKRTCLYCIAQHGTKHPLDERLESHVQCRCTPVPDTFSWQWLGIKGVQETQIEIEPGKWWFDRQPYDTKVAIMHPAAYEAYRTGWPWREFIREIKDPVWGKSGGPRPLIEVFKLDDRVNYWLKQAEQVARRRISEPQWFELRDLGDRVRAVLERRLGRASLWGGEMRVYKMPRGHLGVWDFDGRWIGINTEIADNITRRFMTLTHEMFHSLSPEAAWRFYREARGWEEGVVEAATRVVFRDVARQLRIGLVEKDVVDHLIDTSYNIYIAELQSIRKMLDMDEAKFFLGLMDVPMNKRYEWLVRQAKLRYKDDPVKLEETLKRLKEVDDFFHGR